MPKKIDVLLVKFLLEVMYEIEKSLILMFSTSLQVSELDLFVSI